MGQRVRIGTFNLESLDERPGMTPSLEARFAALRPPLIRLDADVVCLQEVNAQDAGDGGGRQLVVLEKLLAGTAYAGYEAVVSMRPSGRGPADLHNLVILSRLPIRASRQYRHALVPPVGYHPVSADPPVDPATVEWDRPVLHAELELADGRCLHVLDVHLRAPLASFIPGQKVDPHTWRTVGGWAEGFFLASIKQVGQALEARLAVERILDDDPEALIAVCGDFNADVRDLAVRLMRACVEDTGNAELEPRSLIPAEQGLPEGRRFSVVHGGRGQLLDHLLLSKRLHVGLRSVEIFNEGLQDEAPVSAAIVQRPAGSFHAAMVAELEL